jgi:SNF2 family DNA or RNA helicase
VLLTTFEYAMLDKRYLKTVKWEYIIIDEVRRRGYGDMEIWR